MLLIILIRIFLNCHIGQMHHHISKFGTLRTIFLVTKTSETERAEPHFEGTIACDQDIESQVKLFTSNQKRLINISTDNVRIFLTLSLICFIVCPFIYLLQFVYQEYTLALSGICRLHDPGGMWVTLELLNKYCVVTWQNICHWHHIHVDIIPIRILFSDWVSFFLHIFSPPLDILDHQVLPRELKMIWKVVDKPKKKHMCKIE